LKGGKEREFIWRGEGSEGWRGGGICSGTFKLLKGGGGMSPLCRGERGVK